MTLIFTKNKSTVSLFQDDQYLQTQFTEKELNFLDEFVKQFDKHVCEITNTKDTEKAYRKLLHSFKNVVSVSDDVPKMIEINNFRSQYAFEKLEEKTIFSKIWKTRETISFRKGIGERKIKILSLNEEGNYYHFIKESLLSDYPELKSYIKNIDDLRGNISVSGIIFQQKFYDKLKIDDARVRLFLAIHFYTFADHYIIPFE